VNAAYDLSITRAQRPGGGIHARRDFGEPGLAGLHADGKETD
jgi:hypothetical protein